MSEDSSYRTILRSSSIMGMASVLNILSSLLKMKVAAVLLGPAGVGLVGLYQNLVQTAATVAGLGFGSVGTRQIAAAQTQGGAIAVGRARRALFWGTLGLSVVGALAFMAASGWIAAHVLQAPERQADVAWLSLGVALTVAAGSQGALLTGLRRIGDLARVQVASGVLGAILGVFAIWRWQAEGLVVMVLVAPAATFALGHWYVARLGRPEGPPLALNAMAADWREMTRLGVALMLSGLVVTLGHLAVRGVIQRELGSDAQGQFQAAWSIGMTYLGFVLGAMGTDYFPRLTAAIGDRDAAVRLVNEQTEVALILAGPVLLAMLAFAPWVIQLLYSAEFAPAVEILRWQLLGDILKVMSWPLGFVLLAEGAGRTFILTESLGMGVFVLGVLIGLPAIGVTATGVAFLALYVAYLPLVWWLGRRRISFRWTRAVKAQALAVMAAAGVVNIAACWSEPLGAVLGMGAAAAMGIWALMRLSAMAGANGRFRRIARVGEWMNRR